VSGGVSGVALAGVFSLAQCVGLGLVVLGSVVAGDLGCCGRDLCSACFFVM